LILKDKLLTKLAKQSSLESRNGFQIETLAQGDCPATIQTRHNQRMIRILRGVFRVAGSAVAFFVDFLAEAARADGPDDEEGLSDGGFRGGVMNYRTGKLDDGTDPYGWYQDD
jgi:hypothetical protein